MKTVGKQLQEARLAKNWTPELAARETKIKIERLHDLEADDYSHFSSPTYARGFVRTYARSLGLDEYKILRQLDNKLPDDDTSNIATDGGVAYLPETSLPPRAAHRDFTGLYIVMGLGAVVVLISVVVLFEAYRVGELPNYFDSSSSTTSTSPATTNSTDTASAPAPIARALPVDSNTPPPIPDAVTNTPVATAPPVDAVDPRALPVDPSQLTASNNTPAPTPDAVPNAPRALPVDPAELNNPPPAAPADNSSPAPPRALPVSAADLAAAASNPPAQQGTTPPVNASAAPVVSPVAQPVTPPPDAAPPAPSTTTAPASPDQPANSAPTAPSAAATPSTDQRLVLTASQDSFVRVTALDDPDSGKSLYSDVLRSGQSVGFAGHRFSVHVGVPSAVDIKLDGVNYGPHSDHSAPETFNVESHLP